MANQQPAQLNLATPAGLDSFIQQSLDNMFPERKSRHGVLGHVISERRSAFVMEYEDGTRTYEVYAVETHWTENPDDPDGLPLADGNYRNSKVSIPVEDITDPSERDLVATLPVVRHAEHQDVFIEVF